MRATTYYSAEHTQYVSIGSSFTLGGVLHSNDWLERASDSDIAAKGLVPVVTVETVPVEYQDYNRTEELVGAERRVTWTRKPQAEIDANRQADIQAKIDALEREALLPRVAREFMMIQFQAVAAAQGVDPMENFGYRKVKELDDKINALRASL